MFKVCFKLRKNGYLRSYSLRGYCRSPKLFFYGISAKNTFIFKSVCFSIIFHVVCVLKYARLGALWKIQSLWLRSLFLLFSREKKILLKQSLYTVLLASYKCIWQRSIWQRPSRSLETSSFVFYEAQIMLIIKLSIQLFAIYCTAVAHRVIINVN